jgi:hypothetical protein
MTVMWLPVFILGQLLARSLFKNGTFLYYAFIFLWPALNVVFVVKAMSKDGKIFIYNFVFYFVTVVLMIFVVMRVKGY